MRNRCASCYQAVGPHPGFHNCTRTIEKQVERLEDRLERIQAFAVAATKYATCREWEDQLEYIRQCSIGNKD